MGTRAPAQQIPIDEYLQGELVSEVRHEYLGGRVHAMVGASDRHNLISVNLATALRPHVRGTACQLFMADMKVRLNVAGQDAFYYPDLLLCCDPADRAPYYRGHPCLIVEVFSEATARIDRREKLLAYTSIPSLRQYLLLSQDKMEAEIHLREDNWHRQVVSEGTVALQCLDIAVPLAVIYEDVPPL